MLAVMRKHTPREGALEPSEDERVRVVVKRLVVEHGSQSAVARRVDVAPQTISRHLDGFPAGKAFAQKIAKLAGLHYETMIGRLTLVRSSRYPNFEAAAEFARRDGVREDAIENARTLLKSDVDLKPSEWLEDIHVEQRKIDRAAKDPVGEAARQAKADAAGDALGAFAQARHDARPTNAERVAAAIAKNKPKGE